MRKAILVLVALCLIAPPSASATSIKQARSDIRKYERKTEGDFSLGECKRAYRMVVCPVLRYNFEILGFGVGPQDWEYWDCVDKRHRVISPLFTDDPNDDCLWASHLAFPESEDAAAE